MAILRRFHLFPVIVVLNSSNFNNKAFGNSTKYEQKLWKRSGKLLSHFENCLQFSVFFLADLHTTDIPALNTNLTVEDY